MRLPPVKAGSGPRHIVLVVDARKLGGDVPSATEAMDSRIGAPEPTVLEAGRQLQRLWLHVHTLGGVVSPHSEIIDSPHAHGRLRRRLGLRRSEVALAVFTVGRALGEVPVSPRLTDAAMSHEQRLTQQVSPAIIVATSRCTAPHCSGRSGSSPSMPAHVAVCRSSPK